MEVSRFHCPGLCVCLCVWTASPLAQPADSSGDSLCGKQSRSCNSMSHSLHYPERPCEWCRLWTLRGLGSEGHASEAKAEGLTLRKRAQQPRPPEKERTPCPMACGRVQACVPPSKPS
uniref:Uncharacterized protein n=1 Tax=Varanus komodoensis TaxID=61221 RepID=A0A8D2IXR2_VARKO